MMLNKLRSHPIEIFALMFLILFIDWSVGYYANALFDKHFDLSSCWGGFAALSGSGTMVALKYFADTFGNSPIGKPFDFLTKKEGDDTLGK